MKRSLATIALMCTCILFTCRLEIGRAQGGGPIVSVLGEPETERNTISTYISVVNPSSGEAITDLPPEAFAVTESGQQIPTTVSPVTSGVAVVIVIDRGGIGWAGDPRLNDTYDLAEALLSRLDLGHNPNGDMVALIGVRAPEEDGGPGLTPVQNFELNDRNLILNSLIEIKEQPLPPGELAPLYDGLQAAIDMIVDNPDPVIRDELAHRRSIIVTFSDGIDSRFSDATIEMDIIDGCRDNDILLYSIHMEGPDQPVDTDNLRQLASRTSGLYMTYNEDTHVDVLSFFDRIVTQREVYLVEFTTQNDRGDYLMRVEVETPIGTSEESAMYQSRLEMFEVQLIPPPRLSYQVPYSNTPRVVIPLSVDFEFPDAIEREPREVHYYRNGIRFASSSEAPFFEVTWDATDFITQTEATRETQAHKTEEFTFRAEAYDPYLGQWVTSEPVNVEVTWEPLPPYSTREKAVMWLTQNWWVLLLSSCSMVGVYVVFVLLMRTRGELARKVVARTTGFLKGITRPLAHSPSPGKLVITRGIGKGHEFRLSQKIVKFGRDPHLSEYTLDDKFVSGLHFSIHREQTQFYVVDEHSRNGTFVNGTRISTGKRVSLPPEAIIEVGQTRLQFRYLSNKTQQELHTDVRFPEKCKIDQQVQLSIQLTIEPVEIEVVDSPYEPRQVPSSEVLVDPTPTEVEEQEFEVIVFVSAEGFEIEEKPWQRLSIPFGQDSERIEFNLVGRKLGTHIIEVEFFHSTRRVGYIVIETDVVKEVTAGIDAQVVYEALDVSDANVSGDRPFATVVVTWQEGKSIDYWILEREYPFPISGGSLSLGTSEDETMGFWRDIEAMMGEVVRFSGLPTEERDSIWLSVRGLGLELSEKVLTWELRSRSLVWPEGSTIIVATNERWIPWELIHDAKDFWGNRFILARIPKISGPSAFSATDKTVERSPSISPLHKIVNVIGGQLRPPQTTDRVRGLFNVLGSAVPIEALEGATLAEVGQRIEDADLIHFTCHGHTTPKLCFQLADDLSSMRCLTPTSLKALPDLPGSVVFANTCTSAGVTSFLGELRNFGWEFYKKGVSVYIGTIGLMPTEHAVAFAEHFYERFLDGYTVGESLRYAKSRAQQENPFWLLYILYGNPFISKRRER